ncbi:FMN-dependent NADH-azoreductase [Paraburkholderia domus]|jgi:Acyl carrier protein phosphodiesterase|uniref:FMN dependent NADH:quinone oxidoreductase n=1 Tax=Paraburkholderia domus TaxID=2793075 RepID=A0A9N8N1C1_9BURK|nr:NAD(P)H-dependent oxidoreductase [Paraburkholderia domus]MBK5051859.1 NAD(P)H-dependent oxidoreductase [Burkholderia sp. R-70006]MBK5063739.1 NAD(P)H-dependent oxidoreductase [Burkholderia sp. R-70199]MBK5088731.1 NAD(P)H-dependent oxidoreductase [Burkholderia sp. R-69927]MBK5122398.1 NAD(P)H-dependent oxidoreductase [Burkholderia sp. R-69980]MBK5167714.1 NAD(P)H-dependent oxidoreductase [Burkholderia sp. R-70211]MBK5182817.1 NAD(P)H-dependent oxidoreductase [Burkholderia sp. R-69749]MCI0
MKIMHVDASAKRERSNSRALSRYFLERLREEGLDIEVDYLDVTVDTPPHVNEAFAIATYTPSHERTPAMKATLASSDALCKRLLDADALVFAMPMYNWSMPSAFKAFIDSITRTGLTYLFAEDGRIEGQLARQKVLFITSRGADLRVGTPYSSMDALTPALKAAFGFLGVADPAFVDAQPLQFSDEAARLEALERARTELIAVAANWAGSAKSQPASASEPNNDVMALSQE